MNMTEQILELSYQKRKKLVKDGKLKACEENISWICIS